MASATSFRVSGHPRPDFVRLAPWVSLDGTWDFVPDPREALDARAARAVSHPERIAVPGAWEEAVAGTRHDWLTCGWYLRDVAIPAAWSADHRVWLVIGAAFATAQVWIDDVLVAESDQGYLPIEADLTDWLREGPAPLAIRVAAPRDKRHIPHGKQRSIPYDDYNGCSFTPSSGIWQSVRLEARPRAYVSGVVLQPSSALDGFQVDVAVAGAHDGTVRVRLDSETDGISTALVDGRARASLEVPKPRLWSPADPVLYDVVVELDADGESDAVLVSGGLREFRATREGFLLNGERIYLRGVLDQGYWPGHGLAAPDEHALIRDLELAAASGFNLVRKHLKAEDPRWLYHADRLGMLVWAEPASTGAYSEAGAAAFERALVGMIERDRNHPSIVIWGAYNEEWGLDWDVTVPAHREAAVRAFRAAKTLDPTRAVVDNSGWSHVETDIVDWHYYNEQPARFAAAVERIMAGKPFDVWHSASYPLAKTLGVDGFVHGDRPIMNSEYGGGWNSIERAWHTRWQTQFLRLHEANHGYVYTELYDIENETVGIYTYDRRAKDQDGFEQRWAHADTVIIPLVDPVAYGADLVLSSSADAVMRVMISHHSRERLAGQLVWAVGDSSGALEVTAEPWSLSGPFEVPVALDDDADAARLDLRIGDIARTFVDVRRGAPPSNLPPDTGWRPEGMRP